MSKQDDHLLNEGSMPTPVKENKARKSWAEEHGGLIFIFIIVSGIYRLHDGRLSVVKEDGSPLVEDKRQACKAVWNPLM